MSFLFGLSVSKKINLLSVKKLCFYFLDVPNYLFKMSYNKFLNKINEDLNIYAQNSA